jgi:hypothetical protein
MSETWDGRERRSDYRNLPVLIQKWEDFIEAQKQVASDLKESNKALLDEVKKMNDKLLQLPCQVHRTKIDATDKNLTACWIVVGAVALAVLGEWIKFLNK